MSTESQRIEAKNKYRELCTFEKSIPVFSMDWWLDAVAGPDNWDVVVIEKGRQIVAALPYVMVTRFGFRIIKMPESTQTLGPWLRYPDKIKYSKKLEFEKKIYGELISLLPECSYFNQNFHYTVTNWLPFYWKGFKQTTRYTYVIDDITDVESTIANFDQAKRKNIRKAEALVQVKFDLSAKEFYENHKMTLAKQNRKISYSLQHLEDIYNASYKQGAGRTIYAVDGDGNIHAALFVIWNSVSAYDLLSTIDPDYRNGGAATLLVAEIIRELADKTNRFDFEGSMIENVEKSFRQFGSRQMPYFNVTRNSALFDFLVAIRYLKKRAL